MCRTMRWEYGKHRNETTYATDLEKRLPLFSVRSLGNSAYSQANGQGIRRSCEALDSTAETYL